MSLYILYIVLAAAFAWWGRGWWERHRRPLMHLDPGERPCYRLEPGAPLSYPTFFGSLTDKGRQEWLRAKGGDDG